MAKKTELELQAHWRSVLEDFAASDFRVGQYCQERKMSKASLYSWSRRLGIPLKNRENLTDTDQAKKDDKQGNFANENSPFSFIELKVPPSAIFGTYRDNKMIIGSQIRKIYGLNDARSSCSLKIRTFIEREGKHNRITKILSFKRKTVYFLKLGPKSGLP